MTVSLEHEIEGLKQMSPTALRERYLEVFGEPTKSGNREFLVHRIAWRIQSLREGGLSERAKRRAEELARDADIRVRPPKALDAVAGPTIVGSLPGRDARLPRSGTVLRRAYRGSVRQVKVLERGFEYDGETYRSLSAVARAITGAHWNGMAFFGLDAKEKNA